MTAAYEQIIKDYPEHMSKEQMRIVCHISKKTAMLLLQTGLVPCVDNGKKTRNYKIATADVIEYLKQRELTPEKYILPEGSYKHTSVTVISIADYVFENPVDPLIFEKYPDVLSVQQAAALSSVTPQTVMIWAKGKHGHIE